MIAKAWQSEAVFATFHFLCKLQMGLVSKNIYYIQMERHAKDKHSSLVGPFVNDKMFSQEFIIPNIKQHYYINVL